ncbi:MAG: nucleoside-diphosphate kinase [Chloroflexi bacterium]|nr:nucleoside-diphosphate kinase [Chloroflexota bacterium]
MERTLIIIKPDGIQRGLAGEIIRRFELRGFRFAGMKLMQVSRELAEEHYAEHQGKPFFESLVGYITSAPVIVMVLEANQDAIAIARTTIGVTKPAEAAPGTIRGDFGLEIGRNLVHASANAEDAQREVGLFFSEDELLDWSRDTDRWIFE